MAHRSARRTAAAAIAIALLAAGCSSSPADEPTDQPTIDSFEPTDADTPSASPRPSDTGSGDSFAVPDDPADIDVAYVQRVLEDAIYPVLDETVRLEVEAAADGATEPPRRVFELIDAVYDGDQRVFAYDDVKNDWKDGELVAGFRTDPGPVTVTTDRLDDVQSGCIVVTFTLDASQRMAAQVDPIQITSQLVPKPSDVDLRNRNPSPWVINKQFTTESVTDASCD